MSLGERLVIFLGLNLDVCLTIRSLGSCTRRHWLLLYLWRHGAMSDGSRGDRARLDRFGLGCNRACTLVIDMTLMLVRPDWGMGRRVLLISHAVLLRRAGSFA
jgi:hypothetical protein